MDEIFRWILLYGTAVLGTVWREAMFFPDKEGFIKPEGRDAGGHAHVLVGANRERGVFRIQNSWGKSWSQNGRAWISAEDLETLLNAQGECCVALERPL